MTLHDDEDAKFKTRLQKVICEFDKYTPDNLENNHAIYETTGAYYIYPKETKYINCYNRNGNLINNDDLM